MQTLFFRIATMLAVASAAMFVPATAPAQSIWLDRSSDKMLALEILKPSFKGEENVSFTTAAYFLSYRTPLSQNVRFAGELPFAHGDFGWEVNSFFTSFGPGSTFGNPYLGVEVQKEGSPIFVEIGVRVPLTSDNQFQAVTTGLVADFDRIEAFMPNTVPFTGMLNYRQKSASGLTFRLRGGPSFLVGTKGGGSEWLLGYSAQIGYETEPFSMNAGITGRANLSEEGNFGERSTHQLGLAANLGLGKVRPGIHFRLPLDQDTRESLNYVAGINLGILLD